MTRSTADKLLSNRARRSDGTAAGDLYIHTPTHSSVQNLPPPPGVFCMFCKAAVRLMSGIARELDSDFPHKLYCEAEPSRHANRRPTFVPRYDAENRRYWLVRSPYRMRTGTHYDVWRKGGKVSVMVGRCVGTDTGCYLYGVRHDNS